MSPALGASNPVARYRKYKWRIYADNNVEKEVIDHLRSSNIDVLWIAEHPQLKREQNDEYHYAKARELQRYLLTRDLDFWNDRRFPLKDSPGVIILTSKNIEASKDLLVLLRKLIDDYNPLDRPLYIDGLKIKLDTEGLMIKCIDRDTQTVSVERWSWSDLY